MTPENAPETATPVRVSTLSDALIASLEQRRLVYRKQVMRCRRRCTERAVHDLRVATRRLIATLGLMMIVAPDDEADKLTAGLRKWFRSFGPLRDVQVQLLKVRGFRETHPVLKPFYTVLLLREQRQLALMARWLRKLRTRGMERTLANRAERFRLMMSNPLVERAAHAAITGTAAGAFSRSVAFLQSVDPDDPSTIHRLRVSFKKFRYTVEALQPLLPAVTAARLTAMNGYQDRMGHIQDNDVLRAMLNKFAAGRAAGFKDVRDLLASEHRSLVETFMHSKDELYSFWDGPGEYRSSGNS